MRKRTLFWLSLLLAAGLAWAGVAARPAAARPPLLLTPFPTPTPGADGVIRYKVQPGDTLWRVAAVAGISVDELRALNNLQPDQLIRPGDILVLGVAGPAQPTPTLQNGETPPTPTPTPTPSPGAGTLCVLLYDDRNGNGLYDEDQERLLADGAVSLNNRAERLSRTGETNGKEAVCFEDLPQGDYLVTMGVPPGYNPTTATTVRVALQAGDTGYVSFGAQRAKPAAPEQQPPQKKSPLLGLLGLLLIAGAVALWFFAARQMRSR